MSPLSSSTTTSPTLNFTLHPASNALQTMSPVSTNEARKDVRLIEPTNNPFEVAHSNLTAGLDVRFSCPDSSPSSRMFSLIEGPMYWFTFATSILYFSATSRTAAMYVSPTS